MTTQETVDYYLTCDGEDCDNESARYGWPQDARQAAIDVNEWRTDGEHDWCPDCQLKPHPCAADPEDTHTCARCGISTPGQDDD